MTLAQTYKTHVLKALFLSRLADFASCVLLLTLSWRTSSGLPLSARGAQECGDCALLLRELLQSIPKLLSSVSPVLFQYFSGFCVLCRTPLY